jgi:hypothetical protein
MVSDETNASVCLLGFLSLRGWASLLGVISKRASFVVVGLLKIGVGGDNYAGWR